MTKNHSHIPYKEWTPKNKMLVLAALSLSLILFALIAGRPSEIPRGLYQIIVYSDVLIADYVRIGGLAATFFNAGLLMALLTFLFWKNGDAFNGLTFAAILTVAGFSFLGKNLLNVWPIIIGVALYARFKKEPFSKYACSALFATTMTPIVTELIFHNDFPFPVRFAIGIIVGLAIGFVIPPLAAHFAKAGQGFNLYNVGFSAGVLLTVLAAVFIAIFGRGTNANTYFEGRYHSLLVGYVYVICFALIVVSLVSDKTTLRYFNQLWKRPGQAPTDFITLDGFSATLFNIGITGMIAVSYILLVRGEMSGVMLGPVFTIMGFAAFGKHPKNMAPIFAGVLLGAFLGFWEFNTPGMLFAALFGTALSPVAGTYGIFWGVVAGFFHAALVRQSGAFHAGLNLYNNGFSAGILAMVFAPILEVIAKPRQKQKK